MATKRKTSTGINALVWKEANLYVAKAVELELASQGKTPKQALDNLQEAIELYFADEKMPNTNISSFSSLSLL